MPRRPRPGTPSTRGPVKHNDITTKRWGVAQSEKGWAGRFGWSDLRRARHCHTLARVQAWGCQAAERPNRPRHRPVGFIVAAEMYSSRCCFLPLQCTHYPLPDGVQPAHLALHLRHHFLQPVRPPHLGLHPRPELPNQRPQLVEHVAYRRLGMQRGQAQRPLGLKDCRCWPRGQPAQGVPDHAPERRPPAKRAGALVNSGSGSGACGVSLCVRRAGSLPPAVLSDHLANARLELWLPLPPGWPPLGPGLEQLPDVLDRRARGGDIALERVVHLDETVGVDPVVVERESRV